jgi:hypothetical protein
MAAEVGCSGLKRLFTAVLSLANNRVFSAVVVAEFKPLIERILATYIKQRQRAESFQALQRFYSENKNPVFIFTPENIASARV